MTKKYMTLIENGFYKDVFLLTDEEIKDFELNAGQELIETPKPSGTAALVKPRWNGMEWTETATPEEIEEQDRQPEQELTENDMMMLAIADLDMQREQDKTEIALAVAELAETILGGI